VTREKNRIAQQRHRDRKKVTETERILNLNEESIREKERRRHS